MFQFLYSKSTPHLLLPGTAEILEGPSFFLDKPRGTHFGKTFKHNVNQPKGGDVRGFFGARQPRPPFFGCARRALIFLSHAP